MHSDIQAALNDTTRSPRDRLMRALAACEARGEKLAKADTPTELHATAKSLIAESGGASPALRSFAASVPYTEVRMINGAQRLCQVAVDEWSDVRRVTVFAGLSQASGVFQTFNEAHP